MTPVLGLVGCGSDADLQYGVRYICENDNIRSEDDYQKTYMTFSKNGYGTYHFYYDSDYTNYIDDYTIKFKYSYLDDDKSTIACFYDSISYGEKNTAPKGDHSDWDGIITVSKNVLMSLSSTKFINEEYLDEEIPEYRK